MPRKSRSLPKILLPTGLYGQTGGRETIDVAGSTLDEALSALATCCPEISTHLFRSGTERPELRSYVRAFIGDTDSRALSGGATPVDAETEIRIVPSIAGGAPDGGVDDKKMAAKLAINPESIDFSTDEYQRYSRHMIMDEVGLDGQKRLKAASVLCIGTGGLGSPLVLYLAAAGVGRIGLVDFDTVDASNLQRQIVHGTKDIGRPKIQSAYETLHDMNPHIQIDLHETTLSSENALDLFKDYDIIVDGTDNFPTRYLVNDACVLLGKPNVYGSIFRFDGNGRPSSAPHLQNPDTKQAGPCYRCMYPEPPDRRASVPSCAEGGVLGVLPGTVGCIQATEAIKLILGQGESLVGRLLLFDALAMRFKELKLRKDPACPICGTNPTIDALIDYDEFCGVGRGNESPAEEATTPMQEITATELKAKIDRGDDFTLVDVREPYEYAIGSIPGSKLIPLATVSSRANELDPEQEIVLQCKGGVRSAQALEILRTQGFTKLINLKGGITAWSNDVDPTVPKY